MITTEYFKYLQGVWNPHRHRQPQLVGPFYLSEWVHRLAYYTRQFEDELEHNLLNADEPGGQRYLRYLLRQLEAILDPIAQLPTAVPTAVRHSAATGHALGHSPFFQQVTQALNARGTAPATPGYDEEEVALPFQNEYIQTNFLAVLRLVKQHLLSLAGNEQPLVPGSAAVPGLLLSAVRKPEDLSASGRSVETSVTSSVEAPTLSQGAELAGHHPAPTYALPTSLEQPSTKLKVKQIALWHVYEDRLIQHASAAEIAHAFGYTRSSSGQYLYNVFQKLNGSASQRVGIAERAIPAMIQHIEAILPLLSERGRSQAERELQTLKAKKT